MCVYIYRLKIITNYISITYYIYFARRFLLSCRFILLYLLEGWMDTKLMDFIGMHHQELYDYPRECNIFHRSLLLQ